jgi:hypothetical protein
MYQLKNVKIIIIIIFKSTKFNLYHQNKIQVLSLTNSVRKYLIN